MAHDNKSTKDTEGTKDTKNEDVFVYFVILCDLRAPSVPAGEH